MPDPVSPEELGKVVVALTEMRGFAVAGGTRQDAWYLERIDRCLDALGVLNAVARVHGETLEGIRHV